MLLEFAFLGTSLFLLLEMSARVYFFGFSGLIPSQINSNRGLPQTGYTRPAPSDSGLVFELKSNLDGHFKFVPFRTNSQGLRDREYALEQPENTFRVAVLGASFALPAGVAIEHAFHSLLEERLSEEFAPTRYEFINFAVGMYNPWQILAMLEQRALAYDPDLILVTATKLSAPWMVRSHSASFKKAKRERSPDAVNTFRRSYPILRSHFYRLLQQRSGNPPDPGRLNLGILEEFFMGMMESKGPSKNSVAESSAEQRRGRLRPAGKAKNNDAENSFVKQLAMIGKRAGVSVVLIRLEFNPSERLPIDFEVERISRANGVHHLDTRDAFVGTRPSDFWVNELDPHPNREAHEIFARTVSAFLRSEGILSK